jgi:hypothetical protein
MCPTNLAKPLGGMFRALVSSEGTSIEPRCGYLGIYGHERSVCIAADTAMAEMHGYRYLPRWSAGMLNDISPEREWHEAWKVCSASRVDRSRTMVLPVSKFQIVRVVGEIPLEVFVESN